MIFNKGEEVYNRKIKTYTHQSQFGCESTFIPEICVAMPQHSILHITITSTDNNIGANTDNNIPYTSGVLTIIKTNAYVRVELSGCNSGGNNGKLFIANINMNTKTLTGWYELNAMPDRIINENVITMTREGFTLKSATAEISNGMCFLNVIVSVQPSTTPLNSSVEIGILTEKIRPKTRSKNIGCISWGGRYVASTGVQVSGQLMFAISDTITHSSTQDFYIDMVYRLA